MTPWYGVYVDSNSTVALQGKETKMMTEFMWFVITMYLFTSMISYVVHAADDFTKFDPHKSSWSVLVGETAVRLLYIFGLYWSGSHLFSSF